MKSFQNSKKIRKVRVSIAVLRVENEGWIQKDLVMRKEVVVLAIRQKSRGLHVLVGT